MQLNFKNAAAAEMLLRTNQGARIALKIVSVHHDIVMVNMVLTVDGDELMISDEPTRLHVGDSIVVPQSLTVRFSVA